MKIKWPKMQMPSSKATMIASFVVGGFSLGSAIVADTHWSTFFDASLGGVNLAAGFYFWLYGRFEARHTRLMAICDDLLLQNQALLQGHVEVFFSGEKPDDQRPRLH